MGNPSKFTISKQIYSQYSRILYKLKARTPEEIEKRKFKLELERRKKALKEEMKRLKEMRDRQNEERRRRENEK